MAEIRWLRAGALFAGMALLAGCNGRPEQGMGDEAARTEKPLPAYAPWAVPMLGRQLSTISRGSTTCKGRIDLVSAKHTGAKKGSEVQGWAWDEAGAKPFDKVVFTNMQGVVIGAAPVGVVRKDVPAAMHEVTTPKVGWSGVIGALDGRYRAVGLTANDAACTFDTSSL